MNIPYVFKKCSKCGEWLVACKVNFHRNKSCKYRLQSKCKKCKAEYHKQYYKDNRNKLAEQHKQYYDNNRDKIAEYDKQYYENNRDKIKQHRENNRDKIAEYDKQYYKENKDKIAEQKKQWYEDNKDKIREQHKQHYKNNRDKKLEQQKQYYENNRDRIKQYRENNKDKIKQYYENNKDKVLEQHKQYYENNKDKVLEQCKQYRATPQGQVSAFNSSCRRRTREQNQGNGINKEQWLECMNFFNWKCAYSGEKLKKGTRTIDHIKPLNRGGEHEIWNLVPMYRPYNFSKQDKDLLEWYKEQDFFSEERLQKIYEWQEYAYKKWGNKDKIIKFKGINE